MRIREGLADVEVPDWAFYNPIQRLSRDIVIAMAKAFGVKRYCEPFAATGIRTLRMFLEAGIEEAVVNDRDPMHAEIARKLLSKYPVEVYSEDSHKLIRKLIDKPCDMVDLDQFGSPWRYIDGAIMLTKPGGILTFIIPNPTDLFGVYPKKCFRIYGSMPVKSDIKFEWGTRIALLYLSQRAAVFDRHIEPILVYKHKYYIRIAVIVRRGVRNPKAWRITYDDLRFQLYDHPVESDRRGGPAWGGALWDPNALERMIQYAPSEESRKFLHLLLKESRARPLYYNVHTLSSALRMNPPRMKLLESLGFVRTHFHPYGIRSPSFEELLKTLISLHP